MSRTAEPHILISPLGRIDEHLLPPLRSAVSAVFGLPTLVEPLSCRLDLAYSPERRQYHSTRILEALTAALRPEQIKVLGICAVDLFIPILTHVYGEAQLNGRAGLISTARLQESLQPESGQATYLERIIKEGLHELGHTFNLKHCPDRGCIMHYCRTLEDVDRKEAALCRYCRVFLHDAFEELGLAPGGCGSGRPEP